MGCSEHVEASGPCGFCCEKAGGGERKRDAQPGGAAAEEEPLLPQSEGGGGDKISNSSDDDISGDDVLASAAGAAAKHRNYLTAADGAEYFCVYTDCWRHPAIGAAFWSGGQPAQSTIAEWLEDNVHAPNSLRPIKVD